MCRTGSGCSRYPLRKRHYSTEPEGFGYHTEENGSDNRLRVYFRYDRSLLGRLRRAAYETVREVYEQEGDGVPAMVGAVQTFGDLVHWHPHSHAVVAEGVFDGDGQLVRRPRVSRERAEEVWSRREVGIRPAAGDAQHRRDDRCIHAGVAALCKRHNSTESRRFWSGFGYHTEVNGSGFLGSVWTPRCASRRGTTTV
ncbi:MAG: hypothetical protein GF331_20265 [Chitinivibrionales bacterium]|nr:hypothetical protein [Chitinivibrionales bacterium]